MGMIVLAPITVTRTETADMLLHYRVNGVGFDFTGWTGTWQVVQDGTAAISGALTLSAAGAITWPMTAAQIEALDLPEQRRGRTLPDTRWTGTATDGTETLNFTAALTVMRAA